MERVEDIIKKMIETVDPNDTAKLDEIDARVGFYLGEHKNLQEYYQGKDQNAKIEHAIFWGHITKYTRSRDALKAIRPEGYMWTVECRVNDVSRCQAWSNVANHPTFYGRKSANTNEGLPTEELAELHAILQAIAYERSQNESPD